MTSLQLNCRGTPLPLLYQISACIPHFLGQKSCVLHKTLLCNSYISRWSVVVLCIGVRLYQCAVASFPDSPTLGHEHCNCGDGESLASFPGLPRFCSSVWVLYCNCGDGESLASFPGLPRFCSSVWVLYCNCGGGGSLVSFLLTS